MLKQIPNICTLLNAVCGIMALLIAVFYHTGRIFNIACFLIILGAFFDSIDGSLARRLRVESPIGKQLDSFSDLISFGIAPICIFVSLHNSYSGVYFWELLIVTFYVSCAIYRLARYNVSEFSSEFEGLPTTASGLILALYILISNHFLVSTDVNIVYSIISFVFIFLLGVAMVSRVKVPRIRLVKK